MVLVTADMKEFSEETREASPANFLIKIESFSLLSGYGIDMHESRPFEAGGYKWKMMMKFESKKEDDDHVSVYFSIAESDSLAVGWEVNAIFTFFIQNQLLDYYHCFRGMTRRFNATSPKWGFSKVMSKRNLTDPSKGYAVDDSCVFGAEVFVIKTQRVNECLSLIKDASSCKRDWKISDFSKLGDVWRSEKFEAGDHYWKVEVYPNGYSSSAKDRYVSIFVNCVDSKKFDPHHKAKAEISISIKSMLNHTHHSRKYYYWFASSFEHGGFPEFIRIADMSRRGLLVDDCCILEVEISLLALALDAPKM